MFGTDVHWKRRQHTYHIIIISNHLILTLSYLWTTSYDRSPWNWPTRAKPNKTTKTTKLFRQCLVWTQKMCFSVYFFELFCSVFEILKTDQPWVLCFVVSWDSSCQKSKAQNEETQTKRREILCFLRHWLTTKSICAKQQKKDSRKTKTYLLRIQAKHSLKRFGCFWCFGSARVLEPCTKQAEKSCQCGSQLSKTMETIYSSGLRHFSGALVKCCAAILNPTSIQHAFQS